MADIKHSFFIECEELLEALQDGLSRFVEGTQDAETINEVFRAVHSIKGGAGAFGFDVLVDFSHVFENCLDAVRAGHLKAEQSDFMLFLRASDLLCDLVQSVKEGTTPAEQELTACARELSSLIGETEENLPADDNGIEFQPTSLVIDLPRLSDDDLRSDDVLPCGADNCFRILFKPDAELFRSANEPLHVLRALAELGTMRSTCLADDLPHLSQIDPEQSYLSWDVQLETDAPASELRSVFDFVEDLCELSITRSSDFAISSDDATGLPDVALPAPLATLPEIRVEPAIDSNNAAELATPQSKPVTDERNPSQTPVAPRQPIATVRVDLARVDRLINQVGELVINQAMLSQSIERAGFHESIEVAAGLDEFMQLTRDIQDSVMAIRAQPVKPLFQRMARITREASAAVGKDVKLRTEGDETELDKTVIERLTDPLTHMIRNAVDHGIESSDDRIKAGKPTTGNITLRACHRAGRVEIEVEDDGGGIDRDAVKAQAIEKALIGSVEDLSDAEVDNLLFLPGFSTVSEVSNLSGRGVGMDVVRNSINSLGGRISIHSRPGSGTRFVVSLPLTLAVQDGMVIRVADQTLVVPLSHILETMVLTDDLIDIVGRGGCVVRLRDRYVPLLDLGFELGFAEKPTNFEGKIALLIASEGDAPSALAIDAIVEQRQVVIKGLQDGHTRGAGISAATILGDGQIALILDVGGLISNPRSDIVPDDAQTKKESAT